MNRKITLFSHFVSKEFDLEKNSPLTPKDFTLHSGKKIWWKCDKGHEWKARIADRTKKNNNKCPFCAGQKPSKENNLSLHPVSKEFHSAKNENKTSQDFTLGSNKKVWWKCEKKHEWQDTIVHRTKNNRKCPFCSGKRPSKENNLSLHKCGEEFHPTKNGNKTLENFTLGSNKKVWWKCEKGHEWEMSVKDRTRKNNSRNCPYCSGCFSSKENNLSLHKCSNEFHPTKNGNKTPKDFTLSSSKKVWWLCSICGHEWKAFISNRNSKHNKNSCPKCALKYQISKPEKELYEWCYNTFSGLKIEANNRKVLDGLEIDIYFPEFNKGIEFNGNYWHSKPQATKRDKRKLQKAKEKGIEIMVVWEDKWNKNKEQINKQIKEFIGRDK